MTIRLTDLDQDDTSSIEMIRDPVGVLLMDETGWSAVSVKVGFSESGLGSPTGLHGAMSWVTNCSFDVMKGVRMTMGRSDVRLKTSDWLKPDLEEMLEDWAADRFSRLRRAELLAKAVDRVMRLSYETIRAYAALSPTREQSLLNMVERSASLATGLRIVLGPQMERNLPTERRLTAATFSAMKFGAFVLEDSTLQEDEVLLRLRPPRLAYAEQVLSRPVPSPGKWQQARLDDGDLLTEETIRKLQALDRPVLVTARVLPVKGAEDPLLATWTIPNGHGFVRKTYTLEEVVEMLTAYRFHDVMVMVGPGWSEPAAAGMVRALKEVCGIDQLAHASWSAGVVAENILCGAMRNGRAPKGENDGVITPESVWIGAHDRIAMRPFVTALQGFGMTLMGGYAGGVRFKASRDPELISAAINAGWELGLHAQMGLIRRIKNMGGEVMSDRALFGGPQETILAPFLTQSMRVGPLWKIDEIIEMGPDLRADAFLDLLAE
jgi:hypothetical protein